MSSDIDVYIYGLGPVEANAKVQHIFDVWKGNLVLPKWHQEDILAVRNSGTVTFARYPIKKLQIVLKLVKDPKDVLLNFDFDVCAMGFDGQRLVMLPRACRPPKSEFVYPPFVSSLFGPCLIREGTLSETFTDHDNEGMILHTR